MLNFKQKNGCKGHQRSNLEWHYIKKLMSPGVLFMWKISYLYQKQHRVGTVPLYYSSMCAYWGVLPRMCVYFCFFWHVCAQVALFPACMFVCFMAWVRAFPNVGYQCVISAHVCTQAPSSSMCGHFLCVSHLLDTHVVRFSFPGTCVGSFTGTCVG